MNVQKRTPIEIWNELKNVLGDEDWQMWNEIKKGLQVKSRLLGIDEFDTHIDQGELEQHHEWYLDNCEDDEIPLNHEEYLREIEPEVINMILGQRWRSYENKNKN